MLCALLQLGYLCFKFKFRKYGNLLTSGELAVVNSFVALANLVFS